MAFIGGQLSDSFIQEFDFAFYPYLVQQGSQLLPLIPQVPITGEMQYIREFDVGDAYYVEDHSSITKYINVDYDKRRLKPRAFECPIALDPYTMTKQGTPDPQGLAAQAANKCGKILDEIILDGIEGPVYTAADKNNKKTLSGAKEAMSAAGGTVQGAAAIAAYDTTQTIAWNDCTLGGNDNTGDNGYYIKAGLSASKVAKAVQKLLEKYNTGPFVCLGSSYALSTARADKRIASSDFNDVKALMAGVNTPYGGVAAWSTSELVKKDAHSAMNAVTSSNNEHAELVTNLNIGPVVEYAYVFDVSKLRMGVSMPMHLDSGLNFERGGQQTLIYRGMYDCIRMFEESVVRIEINRNPPANNNCFVG